MVCFNLCPLHCIYISDPVEILVILYDFMDRNIYRASVIQCSRD